MEQTQTTQTILTLKLYRHTRIIVQKVSFVLQVRRQRKQLLGLSDHQLKDIGLNREDVVREAGRPFWDLPMRSEFRLWM
ncbi:MAG: DUF1127 domain-containing protein [Gammaproteobacteria bacterium]|nr:DUF1127 domain-containing protein [Gammaproteobacteria bacterium]